MNPITPWPGATARRLHFGGAPRILVIFILGLIATSPGARAAEVFRLPAVFADNMVLQQDTDDIKETVVWGWASPRLRIRVEFQDQKLRDTADSKTGLWRVRLTKLKTGGPFNMLFYDDRAKTDPLIGAITNVVIGEVWVLGSQPSALAAFHPNRSRGLVEQMQSRAGGGFRLLSAPALPAALSADPPAPPWQVIRPDDLLKRERFSNQAAYLAQALLVKAPIVGYVGIIETSESEPTGRAVRGRALPEKLGGIAEAFAAYEMLRYARQDSLDALARYRQEVAELKRSGVVTNAPPPVEIKTPKSLQTGSLKDFDFTIRGAIW